MELRQGTDQLRLAASSWPNVGILGAGDLGKSSCGAVRGGDRAAIPGAALRAGECARSWGSEWDSAYPEYPVLVLSTPQPDSPTPSPSPAQPRLLPIPGGPHPVPISPSESSTPGDPSPSRSRLPTRVPSIPSRGPARPLGAEGPSLPHIPGRCRHRSSTQPRPPGPLPAPLPSPGSGPKSSASVSPTLVPSQLLLDPPRLPPPPWRPLAAGGGHYDR